MMQTTNNGGGGSSGDEENSLNPPGDGNVTAELQLEKPARFFVERYYAHTDHRARADYHGYNEALQTWVSVHNDEASALWLTWRDGAGGSGGRRFSWSYETIPGTNNTGADSAVQSWPASRWPELVAGQQVVTDSEGSTTNSTPAPVVLMEHCDVQARQEIEYSDWQYRFDFARQADAVVKLFTGGRSVAKAKTLWELTGNAMEILDPWAQPPYGNEVPMRSIPPEQLKWGGLGQLAADGKRFEQLPDGNVVNAKIESTRKQYTFQPGGNPLGLKLDGVTFTGTGYHDVLMDTNGQAYATPHWQTNRSHPALFESGRRVQATAHFTQRVDSGGGEVIVRGQTSKGFTLWATNSGPGGVTNWSSTAVADSALPTNRVDFFNTLDIVWSYAVTNEPAKFHELGISKNQVYVSLTPPATTDLYHTVVHLACSISGATSFDEMFQNTWSHFANRTVKTWDGQPIYYYKAGTTFGGASVPLDTLLAGTTHIGQCGAFMRLLSQAWYVNGAIDWSVPEVGGESAEEWVIVKAWEYGPTNSSSGNFKWNLQLTASATGKPEMVPAGNVSGTLMNVAGIPGQNVQTPSQKIFGKHVHRKRQP